jgi:DNA-binding beta-propeller fold protein YncE
VQKGNKYGGYGWGWRAIQGAAVGAVSLASIAAAQAQILITGNDEKRSWNETGKTLPLPPGKDSVSIIDIRNRVEPHIIVNVPLKNSIHGPPTNLAVTPNSRIALIANSVNLVQDGDDWKEVPDDQLFIIDLKSTPPHLNDTLRVGKEPSGIAINHTGTLALVANRADNTVSVVSISGRDGKVVDTIQLTTPNGGPSAVAITPDGKQALVTLPRANKVALLSIDGTKVTDTGYAMTTGLSPYTVEVTPDGKLALVNNQGGGASDGQADTVAVIDLEQKPPRVIDQVVVGDGPEGLAISPAGGYAASLLLNGTGSPKGDFFHHEHSLVALLRIEGKKVHKVAEAEIDGVAEGIAFSPDGRFLYVSSFSNGELAILRMQGTKLVPVGLLKLPGHPASLRATTP